MSLILYKQVDSPIEDDEDQQLTLQNADIILRDSASRSIVVYNKASEELTIYQHDLNESSEDVKPPLGTKRKLLGGNSTDDNQEYCPTCGHTVNHTESATRFAPDKDSAFFKNYDESYMHDNYFKLLNKGLLDSNVEKHKNIPSKLFTQGYYKAFFQELGLIGIGARGSVYKVQHVLLNSLNLGIYALKKIAIGDDMQLLTKSLEEVKLLNKLTNSHPNLIGYNHVWLEMDKSNGIVTDAASNFLIPCVFILQQFCPGGNLEDCLVNQVWLLNEEFESSELKKMRYRLKRKSRSVDGSTCLSSENIISILRDVAAGLAKLHEIGIIHRDLKPSNCLLNAEYVSASEPFPSVVISDFGESQFKGQLRSRTGCTGTPEFTAPEVLITTNGNIEVNEFSFKSDMYSLGMIAYFLVFKKLPWRSYDTLEQLKDMVKDETFSYESLINDYRSKSYVTPKIFKLIDSLLSHNPEKRPTAAEVVDFLDKIDSVSEETYSVIHEDSPLIVEPLMIAETQPLQRTKRDYCAVFRLIAISVGALVLLGFFEKCPAQLNYVLFLVSGLLWRSNKPALLAAVTLCYVGLAYSL